MNEIQITAEELLALYRTLPSLVHLHLKKSGLPADPDDLLHEAMLRLMGSPSIRLNNEEDRSRVLLSYATVIVRNLVLDHARKSSKCRSGTSEEPVDPMGEPVDQTARLELTRLIRATLAHALVNKLRPDERRVIHYQLQGLTPAQIAESLAKDVHYVYRTRASAAKKLRSAFRSAPGLRAAFTDR